MRLSSFLVVAAVTGAAVAGYLYYKNYKKVHEELEKDFDEFEDDRGCTSCKAASSGTGAYDPNKKYTSLSADKSQFADAARNTFEAAKGMVPPAKNIARDVADIIQEKACDANVVAGDYYNAAKDKVVNAAKEAKDRLGLVEENALGKDTVDDVVIDIDVAGNIREEY